MRKFGFTSILTNKNSYSKNEGKEFTTHIYFVDKFQQDKINYEDDSYALVLDGVVLNKKSFASEGDKWSQTIISLYQQKGDAFFLDFRGSFCGILYDKTKDRYVIFTDHIGSKFVYYSELGDSLVVSTMISDIYELRKRDNYNVSLSEESAYLLLSYGFMLGNRTLCEEIKKIQPGCYVVYENGKYQEIRYCLLDNTPNNSIKEEDAIEILENEFRRAIALEFEKDIECGAKKHLVALSAGLDSRMTCWVAHEMGYMNQFNITFSQTDYWDEIIPQKISSDLKHEWLFKSLDNGLWLYDLDEITNLTGGNVLYYGLAHSNSLLKNMNFGDFGILHSGQLGDVVFSTKKGESNSEYRIGIGAYSSSYLNRLSGIKLEEYANAEIANFYYRYFSGANNGQFADMQYLETCSPFMDWDVLNTVLKIPSELRVGHKLYIDWILKKYPEAAKYPWEKIGCRIDRKWGMININGSRMPIEKAYSKLMIKLRLKKASANNKNMNPIPYYLITNKELGVWMQSYFTENIKYVPYENLRKDMLEISKTGSGLMIIQAVSLLSACKFIYGSNY